MIKKIVKVDNIGIFQRWSPGSAAEDFARINVIYGGNGSGKSTLAQVFGKRAHGDANGAEIHIDVLDENGTQRRVSARDDPFWDRVRVFNKDFVKRSLLFDIEGRSDALPLLVLGTPNVDRAKRLTAINERLKEIDEELPKVTKCATDWQTAHRKIATDTARTISEELQAAGSRFSSRSYNATKVREALKDPKRSAAEPPVDVASDLQVIQSKQMGDVAPLPTRQFSLAALATDIELVLAESITNNAIVELKGNSPAEQWVQEGLALHDGRDHCFFCGNELTEDRGLELDRHFDASFTRLQAKLVELEERLSTHESSVVQVLAGAHEAGLLYPDLRDAYIASREAVSKNLALYRQRISSLQGLIRKKRAAPFSLPESDEELPGVDAISFESFGDVLDDHNVRNANFQKSVTLAADRVERSRLAGIVEGYKSAMAGEAVAQGLVGGFTTERRELLREREELDVEHLDSAPLAEELTRDIATLLGRAELSFRKQGDKYAIERHGEPATALSEGEQTAVSLLYFLCSLRDEETKGIRATVIIDDPVSSLDQEILVGASGHLWSALVGNGSKHQVILLTHSFELFRMWSNQLDRLPDSLKKTCSFTIAELRTRYENPSEGVPVRRPRLLSWSDAKKRKKLRSQYHYLFWRVGNVIADNRASGDLIAEFEAMAIIPNAARKMLEAFLAFKYPSSIGDFEGSMRRALEHEAVTDPVRQRVTRFLHQQSHNEEADIGRGTNFGESISVLASSLEFIKAIDRQHFEEMCRALDIDQEQLQMV
ncbi:AAA family ATPase [Rhodoglobus sp.]